MVGAHNDATGYHLEIRKYEKPSGSDFTTVMKKAGQSREASTLK
jgi:hypothetical protein